MVIVFATDTIGRGGKERQLFILTSYLLNRGHNVRIITLRLIPDNYIKEYHIPEDFIIALNGGNKFQNYLKYRKVILVLQPDIVFSWDLQTSFFNLSLSGKRKFAFINGSIQHGIRLFRLSHLIRSFICWFSPFVVANSYAGLKANNLKTGDRRFVLYNGIENKFINTLMKGEIIRRRSLLIPGYTNNPGVIYISVANLVPYKDYLTVIKALGRIKDRKQFYYFIIGEGPMRHEIEKVVKETGLRDRIFFTGKIENVNDYFFISDVLIHSSRGEGISNAILEGMYAGLPVIATNVGGIPETVFPGSSMLFPYKDHKTLYDCLVRAPEVFKDFDSQSSEYKNHLRKFSVEKMVKTFEDILKEVIGNR